MKTVVEQFKEVAVAAAIAAQIAAAMGFRRKKNCTLGIFRYFSVK